MVILRIAIMFVSGRDLNDGEVNDGLYAGPSKLGQEIVEPAFPSL